MKFNRYVSTNFPYPCMHGVVFLAIANVALNFQFFCETRTELEQKITSTWPVFHQTSAEEGVNFLSCCLKAQLQYCTFYHVVTN